MIATVIPERQDGPSTEKRAAAGPKMAQLAKITSAFACSVTSARALAEVGQGLPVLCLQKAQNM